MYLQRPFSETSKHATHRPEIREPSILIGDRPCRADKTAVVHAGIGRVTFPQEHLETNFVSLAAALLAARPKGVKGSGVSGYFLSVLLSSTMGPGVPVTLSSTIAALQSAASARRA